MRAIFMKLGLAPTSSMIFITGGVWQQGLLKFASRQWKNTKPKGIEEGNYKHLSFLAFSGCH